MTTFFRLCWLNYVVDTKEKGRKNDKIMYRITRKKLNLTVERS